jgi:hypothetical protein
MGQMTEVQPVVGIAVVDGITMKALASSMGARATGVEARVKGPEEYPCSCCLDRLVVALV